MTVQQRSRVLSRLFLSACLSASPVRAGAQSIDDQVADRLRNRVEAAGFSGAIEVGPASLFAVATVSDFYVSRVYRPGWSAGGRILAAADQLMSAVRAAGAEGLDPTHYHLEHIERLMEEARAHHGAQGADARLLADLDLLLTDAFLIYGSHLLSGRVNPETFDPEWIAARRGGDLRAILDEALAGSTVGESLRGLLPQQPGYVRLKEVLAAYRDIAARGGWQPVPSDDTLELGVRSGAVVLLRNRLAATGDLPADAASPAVADPNLFDDEVDRAARRFQRRHGLGDDGVVGPATLAALNIPAERRVHQIELNLERWRWLPQDLGERHILVNIAAFELEVMERDSVALEMRVIVGRPYRRTPVFSGTMTYLVLSPYWHVPYNLAVQDKLPLIQKDPSYFASQKIRVYDGWGSDAREVDPTTVDWAALNARNFPYRLRQDPGPLNALGGVKFMFPNKFNVYLHDTPARELFSRSSRDFSSGCIRLENPLGLAQYLLSGDPTWTPQSIRSVIDAGVERTVILPRPIQVHLLHWSAWVDRSGVVHLRPDLYGRDARLEEALHRPPVAR